jgi:hypothetical protein
MQKVRYYLFFFPSGNDIALTAYMIANSNLSLTVLFTIAKYSYLAFKNGFLIVLQVFSHNTYLNKLTFFTGLFVPSTDNLCSEQLKRILINYKSYMLFNKVNNI